MNFEFKKRIKYLTSTEWTFSQRTSKDPIQEIVFKIGGWGHKRGREGHAIYPGKIQPAIPGQICKVSTLENHG